MADIRINALATTAASTASDDFVAVDGSANGTRKLNAFSPTFGGNATVGGNLTVSGTGGIAASAGSVTATGAGTAIVRHFVATGTGLATEVGLTLDNQGTGGKKYTWWSLASSSGLGANGTLILRNETDSITPIAIAPTSGNVTLAGNLTVSGTGTSSVAGNFGIGTTSPGGKLDVQSASAAGNTVLFRGGSYTNIAFATGVRFVAPASTLNSNRQFRFTSGDSSLTIQGIDGSGGDAGDTTLLLQPSGGNLLIGTTTDSANGKLQLATHTTSAGGIGFGTDTALYRYGAGRLGLTHIGGNTPILYLLEGTTETARLWTANGPCYLDTLTAQPIYFRPNGTTALTLDSSQNATFAGNILVNSTYSLGAAATGNQPYVQSEKTGKTLDLRGGVNGSRVLNNAGTAAVFNITDGGDATFAGQITASGISHKLGSGGTGSANALLTIDGSSASSYGPYIVLQRNSTNKWQFGTYSGINGGTSDDFLLYNPTAANEALKIAAATSNATFAGGIIGMTQGNVDNISDDGVASFTPLYNRGFIVINNPDYSQNALIAYFKAGSSYLLYSITKSADVTLNNSTTLTGTTGTDGKLNIGYNNSIIYIENRLGGIGNFQRYALGGTN